jgi:hypothetical protein
MNKGFRRKLNSRRLQDHKALIMLFSIFLLGIVLGNIFYNCKKANQKLVSP